MSPEPESRFTVPEFSAGCATAGFPDGYEEADRSGSTGVYALPVPLQASQVTYCLM